MTLNTIHYLCRHNQCLKKFIHVLTCLCDYSLFTHCSFDSNKNKNDFHRGEGPIKKFCANVRKQATEIVKCEKKGMIPLTEKQEHKYKKTKILSHIQQRI